MAEELRNNTPRENNIRARKLIELDYSDVDKRTIEGKIMYVIPSFTCQFPDNTTGCVHNGVGFNLYNFVSKYGQRVMVPGYWDKITITAGTCLIGLE